MCKTIAVHLVASGQVYCATLCNSSLLVLVHRVLMIRCWHLFASFWWLHFWRGFCHWSSTLHPRNPICPGFRGMYHGRKCEKTKGVEERNGWGKILSDFQNTFMPLYVLCKLFAQRVCCRVQFSYCEQAAQNRLAVVVLQILTGLQQQTWKYVQESKRTELQDRRLAL